MSRKMINLNFLAYLFVLLLSNPLIAAKKTFFTLCKVTTHEHSCLEVNKEKSEYFGNMIGFVKSKTETNKKSKSPSGVKLENFDSKLKNILAALKIVRHDDSTFLNCDHYFLVTYFGAGLLDGQQKVCFEQFDQIKLKKYLQDFSF